MSARDQIKPEMARYDVIRLAVADGVASRMTEDQIAGYVDSFLTTWSKRRQREADAVSGRRAATDALDAAEQFVQTLRDIVEDARAGRDAPDDDAGDDDS